MSNRESLASRLEMLAQTYNGVEHRHMRYLLRQTIRELMSHDPANAPDVEYAGALPRIVEFLNEHGPARVAELRSAIAMSPSTITAAIRRGVTDGKLTASDSTKGRKPCRVYSTREWDAAHQRMQCDIASTWMRNPVITESADVQD